MLLKHLPGLMKRGLRPVVVEGENFCGRRGWELGAARRPKSGIPFQSEALCDSTVMEGLGDVAEQIEGGTVRMRRGETGGKEGQAAVQTLT